jgi:glutamyl/glutaminyl-tRNA synthetase
MEITHVIRGAGHLSNTPKQALLFDALGHDRPVFVHLPTVLNRDGAKLSKRTGASGVGQLRADGLHPHGVVNYLSLLGWSPGDDCEIFSLEELAERLDLDGVGASNTSFDPEKMRWVSSQHIAKMSVEDLAAAVEAYVDTSRFPLGDFNLRLAIDAIRSRLHMFGEINDTLSLLFPSKAALETAHRQLAGEPTEILPVLEAVRARLESLEPWSAEVASAAIREIGQELQVRGPSLFHPVRLALCGYRSGPDLGKIIAAVGRERTVGRLTEAIVQISMG